MRTADELTLVRIDARDSSFGLLLFRRRVVVAGGMRIFWWFLVGAVFGFCLELVSGVGGVGGPSLKFEPAVTQ